MPPKRPRTQDDDPYDRREPPAYGDLPDPVKTKPPEPEPPPTETPSTTTPPPVVDPWATAPADGNWEAWFRANTKGELSPSQLIALEATLAKHGIKVLRNAAGVAGKITLPNGQIVDVIEKAGSGGTRFQWLTGDGGAEAAVNAPDTDWFAANLPAPDPFTTPETPDYLRDPYTTPARPGELASPYVPPTFRAPGFDELEGDPGYQARLRAGVLGRDRMAAARGSILSGGHGKAIERYAQEFANDEYSDLYGRRFGEFQTHAGLGLGARQMNESAYQNDITNAQNQYATRRGAFQNVVDNATNQYGLRYRSYRDVLNDQFRLAELGANTTVAGAPR